MKINKVLLSVVTGLLLSGASLLGAGVASAQPEPTYNGYVGAGYMTNGNAFQSMLHAMTVNSLHGLGSAGMWCAVYITNAIESPGTCH